MKITIITNACKDTRKTLSNDCDKQNNYYDRFPYEEKITACLPPPSKSSFIIYTAETGMYFQINPFRKMVEIILFEHPLISLINY